MLGAICPYRVTGQLPLSKDYLSGQRGLQAQNQWSVSDGAIASFGFSWWFGSANAWPVVFIILGILLLVYTGRD
jgi:hypothetical protein